MSIVHELPAIRFRSLLLALLLSTTPAAAVAGGFEIDWWTIDNGGTLNSTQGDWSLAGTLGQWDASDQGASSGVWFLEGGFWAFSAAERSDGLFNDRFEFSPARVTADPSQALLSSEGSSR